jgi:hypothetical protein
MSEKRDLEFDELYDVLKERFEEIDMEIGRYLTPQMLIPHGEFNEAVLFLPTEDRGMAIAAYGEYEHYLRLLEKAKETLRNCEKELTRMAKLKIVVHSLLRDLDEDRATARVEYAWQDLRKRFREVQDSNEAVTLVRTRLGLS